MKNSDFSNVELLIGLSGIKKAFKTGEEGY